MLTVGMDVDTPNIFDCGNYTVPTRIKILTLMLWAIEFIFDLLLGMKL